MSSALSKKYKPSQDLVKKIKKLENQVYESKIYLNNIVILSNFLGKETPSVKLAAIISLTNIFKKIITNKPTKSENIKKLDDWTLQRFSDFLSSLLPFTRHSSKKLQNMAVTSFMTCLKLKDYSFGLEYYKKLIRMLLKSQDPTHLTSFIISYFKYKDLAIIGFEILTNLLEKNLKKKSKKSQSDEEDVLLSNTMHLLQNYKVKIESSQLNFISSAESTPFFSDSYKEPTAKTTGRKRKQPSETYDKIDQETERERYQNAYIEYWLCFLRNSLSAKQYFATLLLIPKYLLPIMEKPGILFEYFIQSFSKGGVISILALNGIYILMTRHQLEYPDFYKKLYHLLNELVFKINFRENFFRYLSIFLSSSYLSVALISAFAKRLARLSLSLPPSSCLMCLGLVFNLLEKHPSCRDLIQRKKKIKTDDVLLLSEPSEHSLAPGDDPYLPDETDPEKSEAQFSSLWELEILKNHYEPDVANFIKSFEGSLARQPFDLGELANISYETQTDKRLNSKFKNAPLSFQAPTKLFGPDDGFSNWQL